jgi:hypothetical protein
MLNVSRLIEDQCGAMKLPLVAVTMAAVPCTDTPVILTLHWHGFMREHPADLSEAGTVAFRSVPSSAMQVNDRWGDLKDLDRAALEAAWSFGAWDVARSERRACARPGARSREFLECRQAFSAFPFGVDGGEVAMADAPDHEALFSLAQVRGYLMWLFRPVSHGIWKDVADDRTLDALGKRPLPCPVVPVASKLERDVKTVYRLGTAGALMV